MDAGDISSIVVAAAAALTAFFAWRGLSTWRRQIKGNAQYEAARESLRCAYRVRDALAMVRSPFMSSGEMAAAVAEVDPDAAELDQSSDEARVRSFAAGYQARWRVAAAALSDLDAARVESEALWGKSAPECFKDLRGRASELSTAITLYLRYEGGRPMPIGQEDHYKQVFGTVFAVGENDAFADRLRDALAPIEEFFRPKLG